MIGVKSTWCCNPCYDSHALCEHTEILAVKTGFVPKIMHILSHQQPFTNSFMIRSVLLSKMVAENVVTSQSPCRYFFRLLQSLIYKCYLILKRLVLETKVLERSPGFSERFINRQIPVVHTTWVQALELIKEMSIPKEGVASLGILLTFYFILEYSWLTMLLVSRVQHSDLVIHLSFFSNSFPICVVT